MKKRKINSKKMILFILSVCLVSLVIFVGILKIFRGVDNIFINDKFKYVASTSSIVPLYNDDFNQVNTIIRGTKVTILKDNITNNDKNYYKIKYGDDEYLIDKDDLTDDINKVVKETAMYVRTPVTFYKSNDSIEIKGLIKKGEKVEILSYDKLLENGTVNMYQVKYNNEEGFVYGKYLVNTLEDALANYDAEGNYKIHAARTNTLMGGSAANLDYYPYEKPTFSNNVIPNEVRAIYMNAGVIGNVDKYIELAKQSNLNAIVVDIKDNTAPGYPAEAMKKYSPTNYARALNSYDKYKEAIKKIKDAGLYVIGRITVFKDSYFVNDNPGAAILDSSGNPYNHDGSFWPSAYQRLVWEFNVALAIESIQNMGFNEIQFDYVRFPDRTGNLEKDGTINLNNVYNEEKAQAIQEFVMYAADEIHKYDAYVSIDVFGESAHNYVTAYGQYWPAISNVADVISGMPYPDHFSKYEYGFTLPVWTTPYKVLNFWGSNYVDKRQQEIPTPAIVRTWIQAYNTSKSPATKYDSYMVSEEIKGLYDAGLKGGFMAWNGSSSIDKYTEVSSALGGNY